MLITTNPNPTLNPYPVTAGVAENLVSRAKAWQTRLGSGLELELGLRLGFRRGLQVKEESNS
jgi:hypothetical protein